MVRVGLIADTHGVLRPEARTATSATRAFSRNWLPWHLLPPYAATTTGAPGWTNLHETQMLQFGEVRIYAIHDLRRLDIAPAAAGVRVVISGHSHKPLAEERNGVLYVNPGSAGPHRFKLPIAAGELLSEGLSVTARIVALGEPAQSELA